MAETAATQVRKKEAEIMQTPERARAERVFHPQVDILARKDDIVVIADMPGVDEQSVDVNLEKNMLSIYGRVEENPFEGFRPLHMEYGIGDYERTFTLSDEIDRDRIEASMKNGVLTLVLPKAAAAKSRKIAVKAQA